MKFILSSISIIAFLSSTSTAQNCGADCKSCTELSSCDADPNCFYVVDGGGSCEIAGTCASDCALCTAADCATGANGFCLFNLNTGTCFGSTCDTDCQNCDEQMANECTNSRAPPFGCQVDLISEDCVPVAPPMTTTPAPTMLPPMTPKPSMTTTDGMLTTDDYLTTDESDSDSFETTDSDSDSMETTDSFDTTTDGSLSDSDSDSMETTDSGMETTSGSDSDSSEMDTTTAPMYTTDSASVDNTDDSIEVDTDTESEDDAQSVNDADDEIDADDMRRQRGMDGFGKSDLTNESGNGSTNVVGAVLAVLGMFVFAGIAFGVWYHYKSKTKAFVSVNVIDVEEHDHDSAYAHRGSEHAVMMNVNEGHAITACNDDDDDIL